jgi:hypothetical protein
VERRGDFAFEAPHEGYMRSVELGEAANQPRWLGDAERQFFVRLADNRYARVTFRMMTRGEHFFVIESALNPGPGNRNRSGHVVGTLRFRIRDVGFRPTV